MSNFLFVWMMLLSAFVSLSSSSWLVCWMMMEVSSFFFVPVLFGFWSVGSMMISLKYFLMQSVGSSLFLFSVLWESISTGGWEWLNEEKEMGIISCLSMMIKLGIFPFHGWMMHLGENLSWKNFFLLSSVQEVVPLVMISKFMEGESVYLFFVSIGMVFLVMFSFLNYSIHWMMMISSLFNVSWMVVASFMSKESLIFFLLVYFSTLFSVFWVLEKSVSLGGLSSLSSVSMFKGGKVVFIFIVFMLMGIPPFGSFLGKAEVLSVMLQEEMIMISLFYVFLSSIFMFLYLKISLFLVISMKGSFMGEKVSSFSFAFFFFFFFSFSFLIWFF